MRREMATMPRILKPIEEQIRCRSKIKKWAYENAYTLLFLSFMFIVTWIAFAVTVLWR